MKKARKMPELILQLKKVRAERNLSNSDILKMVLEAGLYISKSSVQRVFAEGSEEVAFWYEDTVQPIEMVLLVQPEPVPVEELDTIQDAQQYVDHIEALQTANEVKQIILVDQDQNIQELNKTVTTQESEIAKLEGKLLQAEEKLLMMEERHAKALEAAEAREKERIADYRQQLAESTRQAAARDDDARWWRRAFSKVLFLLVTAYGVMFSFLIIDQTNPNLGYFWMEHKITSGEIAFIVCFCLIALAVTFVILRRKKLVNPPSSISENQ